MGQEENRDSSSGAGRGAGRRYNRRYEEVLDLNSPVLLEKLKRWQRILKGIVSFINEDDEVAIYLIGGFVSGSLTKDSDLDMVVKPLAKMKDPVTEKYPHTVRMKMEAIQEKIENVGADFQLFYDPSYGPYLQIDNQKLKEDDKYILKLYSQRWQAAQEEQK